MLQWLCEKILGFCYKIFMVKEMQFYVNCKYYLL